MKADQGLMEEIDRSFGDGPGHPPLEQRIGAGRGRSPDDVRVRSWRWWPSWPWPAWGTPP